MADPRCGLCEAHELPDRPGAAGSKLVADAAVGFPTVSNDGKTYTFTIRNGWRSNTGEALTAANFAGAFNRDLNPKTQSPAVPFITGANGIVGAQAVSDGKAATASGIVARGQKLTIKLIKPDGSFLSKLAMDSAPSRRALRSTRTGRTRSPRSGRTHRQRAKSAVRSSKQTRTTTAGPHNVEHLLAFAVNNRTFDQSLLQVKAGQLHGSPSRRPPAHGALRARPAKGINKGRYFVSGGLNIDYAALNTSRPAFSKLGLRAAAQYAIDRPAMVRQRGYLAGRRDYRSSRPGSPDTRTTSCIRSGLGLCEAKALASGAGGCKDVTLYTGNTAVGQGLPLATTSVRSAATST